MKCWDRMPWSSFFDCWTLSQLFHSPLSPLSRRSLVLLSAMRIVSSAYLRLLIFLPEILFPACASSSLAFCLMYSAYKLNRQDDRIQPWCAPFSISNQFVNPCLVLTVASSPVYRFLKRQVMWPGIPNSLRLLRIFNKAHKKQGVMEGNKVLLSYKVAWTVCCIQIGVIRGNLSHQEMLHGWDCSWGWSWMMSRNWTKAKDRKIRCIYEK